MADLVLVYSLGLGLFCLGLELARGGDEWKQADWLINSQAGPVRRGGFGDMVLALAALLGVQALTLVVALQALFLGLLYAAYRALVGMVAEPGVRVLLLMSPAMFIMFWAADPNGAGRKEVMVFAGLVLSVLALLRRREWLLVAGAALMGLGVWAHEGLACLVPLYLGLMWWLGGFLWRPLLCAGLAGLVGAVAGYSVYQGLFVSGGDKAALCGELLGMGLNPAICTGSIDWIDRDLGFGMRALGARLDMVSVPAILLAAGVSFWPFVAMGRRLEGARLWPWLLVVLPVLPLYGVAVDWGRWLSFQVFSLALVLAAGLVSGRLRLVQPLAPALVMRLALMALLVSPAHTVGIYVGGAVVRPLRMVLQV
jgi:hypothetical protein